MRQVDLLFGIHDHQPVGNFGHVFRDAYDRCYRPFLDVFAQYPKVKASIHTSGPLLEWLEANEPGYLDLLRALVAAGRVEILGGGFYEPILPMLHERDAVGQLKRMSAWTEARLGVRPTGLWLAERVWDPTLPRVVRRADLRFTVLDDTHFRAAGLRDDQMVGYYLTEREGEAIGVYPIDKNLRYKIPFAPPAEVIDYLRSVAREPSEGQPVPAVTYADDGEKFGLWPDTYRWVFDESWLARFFQALTDNADWLHTRTLGEHFAASAPTGRLYLPTASYDEMMEWALPAERIPEYERAVHEGGAAKPFVRGGFWPNFLVKYPESNWMAKRAAHVSGQVAKAMGGDAAVVAAAGSPPEMLRDLWRAQCNCGYWHGLFGGLYLNYIRHENFSNLIRAGRVVAETLRSREDHLEHEIVDLDRDGHDEIAITGNELNAFLAPDYGGSLVELDLTKKAFHLSNLLARRVEPYHAKLAEAEGTSDTGGPPKTIHDRVRVKEPGLAKRLVYDRYLRHSFLDHLLALDTTLERFAGQRYHETAWLAGSRYRLDRRDFGGTLETCTVALSRRTEAEASGGRRLPIELTKTYHLSRRSPSVEVHYRLVNRGEFPAQLLFATELNLSLLAGNAPDRYYDVPDRTLEDRRLASEGSLDGAEAIDLVDEWSGIRVMLRFSPTRALWRHPVETVSQSEGGFEATYQGSCLVPTWPVALSPGESAERSVRLEIAST